MPELPEVETVRRGLAPVLVGKRIARVETRRADLRFPFPQRFRERLEGKKIASLTRRGKYLVATLSSGESLIVHLGMTGRFTVFRGESKATHGNYVYETGLGLAHDHVVLVLEDGSRIVYNDPRRFGFMLLVPRGELSEHPLLRSLGAEPLDKELTAEVLAVKARGKKANLKSLLMDQRIVAGLGNIYASEALHRAGLDPSRSASVLADAKGRPTVRAQKLVAAIRAVLNDAIGAGGSTLRDYRQADGASGGFQKSFAVYGREGERCIKKGCHGTIRRRIDAGRATFFCSRCQR